jgi:hypothetical protein
LELETAIRPTSAELELVTKPASKKTLRLFEIALVLVRLDHVANRVVNADHGIFVRGFQGIA